MAEFEPIEGRCVWRGTELGRRDDWIRQLDDAHRAELDRALDAVRNRPLFSWGQADFPLPRTSGLLADIREELENGTGIVRLRGLDVRRYGEDELRQLFWGIGCHLGTALYQDPAGEVMGEVRDETRLATQSFTTEAPGGIASARARARSSGPLRFHTDLCDVIALLCVRNAGAGGVSKIASSAAIYNEILRRRPDLLALLRQDYWRARPRDGDGENVSRTYALPVFGVRSGKLTSQYSRTFVELAQQDPAVPRITAAQNEALDLLAEVAEALCLEAPFAEGDIQLLNNNVTYHGRTAYEDDPGRRQERLLFRLWLATPNSRALPPGFEVLWGEVAPGALRGGVLQPVSGKRALREHAEAI